MSGCKPQAEKSTIRGIRSCLGAIIDMTVLASSLDTPKPALLAGNIQGSKFDLSIVKKIVTIGWNAVATKFQLGNKNAIQFSNGKGVQEIRS
eukprot:4431574-Ditylum_brightwellii.AAC.1